MKSLFIVTAIFILIVPSIHTISANPFACKINKEFPIQKKTTPRKIVYKGYALIDREKFAFVELNDKQYTLTKGQKLKNLIVLKISPESVRFSIDNKVFDISIKKDQE